VREERGQAVLVVVLALAISAAAVIGLRTAQDRIVVAAHAQRAGEAAVEAAAQAVADLYGSHAVAPAKLVTDPRALEAARSAADELARLNGASGVAQVE